MMVWQVQFVVQTRGGHQGNNLQPNHLWIFDAKYMKRSWTKEPLIQVQLHVDNNVCQVATMKVDHKTLAISLRELVAAEAHYH